MSLTSPYSEVYLVGDGVTTVFAYGANFTEVSPNYVKCVVYLEDGTAIVPTYTVDTSTHSITISALTLPDSTVLTAPPLDSTVRIYRDVPEAQNVTASQIQSYTGTQLERAFDAMVAMIQENTYTTEHKTIRLTEPQRDIIIQKLSETESESLLYWDNTKKEIVVTNYPQGSVVLCAGGLVFKIALDPDTNTPFLKWSTGNNEWHSLNVDAAQTMATNAYALAGDAYTLGVIVRGELNSHKGDKANPHETTMTNLKDAQIENLSAGQFLSFDGENWRNVNYSATAAWGGIGGTLSDQTDLQTALNGKVNDTGDDLSGMYTHLYGSRTRYNSNATNIRCDVFMSGEEFTLQYKYGSTTNSLLIRAVADLCLYPSLDNRATLGLGARRWRRLWVSEICASSDGTGVLTVPTPSSNDTLALKSQVDDAANSGEQLYTTGVWYAKMYAATTVPTGAEYEGRNYADFSQVDGDNNPIIVVYTYTSGAWALTETITPPKNHNGYMTITSKIWDIVEQTGQQGGLVLWAHNQGTFTPYPRIVSFDGANITNSTITGSSFSGSATLSGNSTVTMPLNPSGNQIVNKDYVDSHSSDILAAIDAEVVGTLTTSANGDITGFVSGTNYLKYPGSLDFAGASSYEMLFVFTTGNSIGANATNIIECDPAATTVRPLYRLYIGTSPACLGINIYNSDGTISSATGTTTLQPDTKYYVKWTWDGTVRTISLSTDGINYTDEITATTTVVPVGCGSAQWTFFKSSYALGTAHMAEWLFKKNGIPVWSGLGIPGLHQRASNRHEVIAFQEPTSTNNYTWYRLYADGWVEQGQFRYQLPKQTTTAVTLPVEMADTNYAGQISGANTTFSAATTLSINAKTTTQVNLWSSSSAANIAVNWEVKGMAKI